MATKKTPAAAKTKVEKKKKSKAKALASTTAKVASAATEMCPICQETGKFYKLKCNHGFHEECLKKIVNLQCPVCRHPIENIRQDIQTSIERNAAQYSEELEEEAELNLLQRYLGGGGSGGLHMENIMFLPPTSHLDEGDHEMEVVMAGMNALHALASAMRGGSGPSYPQPPVSRRPPSGFITSNFGFAPPLQPRIISTSLASIENGTWPVRSLPRQLQLEMKLAVNLIKSFNGASRYMQDFTINIPIDSGQLEPGELFNSVVIKFIETYIVTFLTSPEVMTYALSDDDDMPPLENSPSSEDDDELEEDEDTIVWYD